MLLKNCIFSCSDRWVKLKESKKKNNYLDFVRVFKKLLNIDIGETGTVNNGLIEGLEDIEIGGRLETIQTTALLRSARILRRVLETCCRLITSERPIKRSQWVQ